MEDFLKFMATALNDYLSKLDNQSDAEQSDPEQSDPEQSEDEQSDDNNDDDEVSDEEAEQIRKIVEGV